jgi:hypothetical protein
LHATHDDHLESEEIVVLPQLRQWLSEPGMARFSDNCCAAGHRVMEKSAPGS